MPGAEEKHARAEGLYPDLAAYLEVFDPEGSEIYPPPAKTESAGCEPRRRSAAAGGRALRRALLLLLIAALAVFIFIAVNIRALPRLE